MPLAVPSSAPTLLIRKDAFERVALTRAAIDQWLNLTADEFRVEGSLVAVGPIYDADALQALVNALEDKGLAYFDDFFELPGNWPDWLQLHVMSVRG